MVLLPAALQIALCGCAIIALATLVCPSSAYVDKPVRRGAPTTATWPRSCEAVWDRLDAPQHSHNRTLVMMPTSGWGDFLHSVASAFEMCAAYGMRCRVLPPDAPVGSVEPEVGQLAPVLRPGELDMSTANEWWCLGSQLQRQGPSRNGVPIMITAAELERDMALWPMAQHMSSKMGGVYGRQKSWAMTSTSRGAIAGVAARNTAVQTWLPSLPPANHKLGHHHAACPLSPATPCRMLLRRASKPRCPRSPQAGHSMMDMPTLGHS